MEVTNNYNPSILANLGFLLTSKQKMEMNNFHFGPIPNCTTSGAFDVGSLTLIVPYKITVG